MEGRKQLRGAGEKHSNATWQSHVELRKGLSSRASSAESTRRIFTVGSWVGGGGEGHSISEILLFSGEYRVCLGQFKGIWLKSLAAINTRGATELPVRAAHFVRPLAAAPIRHEIDLLQPWQADAIRKRHKAHDATLT